MYSRTNVEPKVEQGRPDGEGATDSAGGAIERGQECIPSCVDLPSAESFEFDADGCVVRVQELAPLRVTDRGTVALVATSVIEETHAHEISPIPSPRTGAERLRRIPVPAGSDHAGGPLVPAVRSVLPRRRGAAR